MAVCMLSLWRECVRWLQREAYGCASRVWEEASVAIGAMALVTAQFSDFRQSPSACIADERTCKAWIRRT
jgi:hypothetical protein